MNIKSERALRRLHKHIKLITRRGSIDDSLAWLLEALPTFKGNSSRLIKFGMVKGKLIFYDYLDGSIVVFNKPISMDDATNWLRGKGYIRTLE